VQPIIDQNLSASGHGDAGASPNRTKHALWGSYRVNKLANQVI
jgi:hypothetical protein